MKRSLFMRMLVLVVGTLSCVAILVYYKNMDKPNTAEADTWAVLTTPTKSKSYTVIGEPVKVKDVYTQAFDLFDFEAATFFVESNKPVRVAVEMTTSLKNENWFVLSKTVEDILNWHYTLDPLPAGVSLYRLVVNAIEPDTEVKLSVLAGPSKKGLLYEPYGVTTK